MEVIFIIKKALLIFVILLLLINYTGKAEIYRIGDTIAGTGIEYRTDSGLGISIGTHKIYQILNVNKDKQDIIDFKLGIGIRKVFNKDNKIRPYIGGAYINQFGLGLKGEVGLQIKAWDHIAVNPAYNFQFYNNGVHLTPGLGIAVEF